MMGSAREWPLDVLEMASVVRSWEPGARLVEEGPGLVRLVEEGSALATADGGPALALWRGARPPVTVAWAVDEATAVVATGEVATAVVATGEVARAGGAEAARAGGAAVEEKVEVVEATALETRLCWDETGALPHWDESGSVAARCWGGARPLPLP